MKTNFCSLKYVCKLFFTRLCAIIFGIAGEERRCSVYADRIKAESCVKWGVQIAGMNLQTRLRRILTKNGFNHAPEKDNAEGDMSMVELKSCDRKRIFYLFEGREDSLIWSCLQGYMGQAWADDNEYPESAQIIVGDFCFFAGRPNENLVKHIPVDFQSKDILMVPDNEAWEKMIVKVYGQKARGFARYAIKKEKDVFDRDYLTSLVKGLPAQYKLQKIDGEMYKKLLSSGWSRDFCSQFLSYERYQRLGFGFTVLFHDEPVSGASSYAVYDGGIEIEVDTKNGYRRRGLAQVCAARLILECLDRGLYPSWDAHNLQSVALAEKLGYHTDKPYVTYAVEVGV